MKTSIRFPSRSFDIRRKVTLLVEQMLEGQASKVEIENAITAVVFAFHSADSQAGNGNGSNGSCLREGFYALADIGTGEFRLFREIL